MLSLYLTVSIQGGSPDAVQLFTEDMHNHGGGEGMKHKKKRRVKHHIHMALYILPLSGILRGVLVLGLIFFASLHTKETAAARYFKEAPAIPHRPTRFRRRTLCCCRQTRAVVKKRRPWLLIKKTLLFPSTDYPAMGKLHREGASPAERDAGLRDWNCQIKHTDGEVSKQVFEKK